jgi:hypothetical protein
VMCNVLMSMQLIVGKLWNLLSPATNKDGTVAAVLRLLGMLGSTALSGGTDGSDEGLVQLRKRLEIVLLQHSTYGCKSSLRVFCYGP